MNAAMAIDDNVCYFNCNDYWFLQEAQECRYINGLIMIQIHLDHGLLPVGAQAIM